VDSPQELTTNMANMLAVNTINRVLNGFIMPPSGEHCGVRRR
jgi:hypothetical protein